MALARPMQRGESSRVCHVEILSTRNEEDGHVAKQALQQRRTAAPHATREVYQGNSSSKNPPFHCGRRVEFCNLLQNTMPPSDLQRCEREAIPVDQGRGRTIKSACFQMIFLCVLHLRILSHLVGSVALHKALFSVTSSILTDERALWGACCTPVST